MTEHERRVNDGNLRAYMNQDALTLEGKIPGYRGVQYPHEKYIDNCYQTNFLQGQDGGEAKPN
jgi:hypothetical protein